jgi:DNA mismatch repair protein MutS2
MSFDTGAEVAVLSLHRKRGVVESVVRPGLYRVQVNGVRLTVREGDLEAVASKKRRNRPRPTPNASAPSPTAPAADAAGLRVLDLHGLTVDEARNRVAAHVSQAIIAGLDSVEIVHGIGTGALRRAVTADLRKLSVVTNVRPHPTNPGALVVSF